MHNVARFVASGLLLCASSAFADEKPEPPVASARVRSIESAETLTRMTCGLPAIADVGGGAQLFDIAVNGKRCSYAPPGRAVPLRVRIEPPQADGWRDVVLEADVPDDERPNDVRAAVDAMARELLARLDGARLQVVQVTRGSNDPGQAPVTPETDDSRASSGRGTRGGGIALLSVGGAGLGIAAIIGVVGLVDVAGHAFGCGLSIVGAGSCGNRDFGGYGIAAGVSAGIGATLMIVGGVVLSSAGPDKPGVSAQVGPTGGSLRVTF
jgi:hypothetical protein